MPEASSPAWWDEACAALAAADPLMADLVGRHAAHRLRGRGDAFATLARSIVGQQISTKAAQSVWLRFSERVGPMVPANVALLAAADMSVCGLSARKGEYLADLSARFLDGRLAPARWPAMDDEAIIAELVAVRGVGRWTAEMFLIFGLMRPDVLPADDIGVINAVGRACFPDRRPARAELLARGEQWRPWRTCATWHLWRSLDAAPVEY